MNKCIPILLAVISTFCLAAQNPVFVEALDEQFNNPSQITLRIRITNNSQETLKNVRARYFLSHDEARILSVSPYYMVGSAVSIDTLGDFLAVNIDIPQLSPGVFPNTSGISLGINYVDYGAFNKASNFSYPNSSIFVQSDNIPVYVNGSIIVGRTPFGEEIPKIRFVGLQPENSSSRSAWLELENYDSISVDLNDFCLKWTTVDSTRIENVTLSSGKKLKICFTADSLECPSAEFVVVNDSLPFGKIGELVLSKNGYPVDYIAWGQKGLMSDSLFVVNERLNTNLFLETEELELIGPGDLYKAGSFYRAIPSKADSSIVLWVLFSSDQINACSFCMPSPISRADTSIVYLPPDGEKSFVWRKVDGAKKYDLIILNASDSTLAYEKVTEYTSERVKLPYGRYLWNVFAFEDENFAGLNASDSVEPDINYIEKMQESGLLAGGVPTGELIITPIENLDAPIYNLMVIPQGARKDSYMLDLKWGGDIEKNSWESPRNSSSTLDLDKWSLSYSKASETRWNNEESWRCWAVAASMMNHYNGGNLTQDEIKFHFVGKNSILNAFPREKAGGGSVSTVTNALKWALNLSDANKRIGRPTSGDIISALAVGRPVVAWRSTETEHIIVIDAVRADLKSDNFVFRVVNTDNHGGSEWENFQTLGKKLTEYWIPARTSTPRMSELYVDLNGNGKMEAGIDRFLDSDEDGVLDFDEEKRFHTLKDNDDSDGDFIKDKIEIKSYTLLEPKGNVSKETYADIDGDDLRAEKDSDSDNGGVKDGFEDLNRNGLYEVGETSPYVKGDDKVSINPDMPAEFALYAISNLRVNDGVECLDGGGYCNVGAAAIGSTEPFPLIIGARASVGNVYSTGNVFFRSNAHIHGYVVLSSGVSLDNVSMHNGTVIDGDIIPLGEAETVAFVSYPALYPLNDYIFSESLVVSAGKTATLSDGAKYRSVKIEGSGKLRINSGEMWVGDLQIESGAKIEFVSPGSQTILHVNGSFIWRGTIQNSDSFNESIARGFKLIQHSANRMYVDDRFMGAIFAPYSHVVLGQSHKLFYGSVVANSISVHQYATIRFVKFNPTVLYYSIAF